MAKIVTRHLTYAWIEYGDPRDGTAFTDGMYNMGWKNAVSGFPVSKKRDPSPWGIRTLDASHPLLPIRWRSNALIISPNDAEDRHDGENFGNPPLRDPIFEEFKKSHDEGSFHEEIVKQNAFISRWVLSPGINKVSDTESNLTADGTTTDFVDLVAISGHGSGGSIWGGKTQALLYNPALYPQPPASDRLRYVIIASCSNVNYTNAAAYWLRPLQRNAPIHGFLGYQAAYVGDSNGAGVFTRFTDNLKAGNGSANTILQAWRNANAADPRSRSSWAAALHVESGSDTMAQWLAGTLKPPPKDGEIRWYSEKNYPHGELLQDIPPDVTVNFFMGPVKITVANKDDLKVGLFPGQKGALSIAKKSGTFNDGDTFIINVYYYRPDHNPGVNLKTLLNFDPPSTGSLPDVTFELLKDNNKQDNTADFDAVKIYFHSSGLSEVKLPYTVNKDALKHYPRGGENFHGYFYLEIVPSDDILSARPSPDAAALREP